MFHGTFKKPTTIQKNRPGTIKAARVIGTPATLSLPNKFDFRVFSAVTKERPFSFSTAHAYSQMNKTLKSPIKTSGPLFKQTVTSRKSRGPIVPIFAASSIAFFQSAQLVLLHVKNFCVD